jgi:hypothetical protein
MEKKMNIKTMFTVIMILTMFSGVKAETVENLERMRAKTLTVMFDKNINLNQRADKVQKLKLKLLDMEKIVLNDKNLSNNPSTNTIKAFENFNFTFLVHSSLEKDKPIAINWLEELGFSSENLLKSRVFRK